MTNLQKPKKEKIVEIKAPSTAVMLKELPATVLELGFLCYLDSCGLPNLQ